MGVHKAWSPSRSYGLVVRLDAQMTPLFSLHSRANGHRHGVDLGARASAAGCYVAAKGGDCVLSAGLPRREATDATDPETGTDFQVLSRRAGGQRAWISTCCPARSTRSWARMVPANRR